MARAREPVTRGSQVIPSRAGVPACGSTSARAFPGRLTDPVACSEHRHRSRWRDRRGISPRSPVGLAARVTRDEVANRRPRYVTGGMRRKEGSRACKTRSGAAPCPRRGAEAHREGESAEGETRTRTGSRPSLPAEGPGSSQARNGEELRPRRGAEAHREGESAEGETRTRTGLPPLAPEASASTNSATSALRSAKDRDSRTPPQQRPDVAQGKRGQTPFPASAGRRSIQ